MKTVEQFEFLQGAVKFRAYNKTTKRIEDVKQIKFFKDGFVLETSDPSPFYELNQDKAVLLRFTDFIDKHRREIYEGDIIRANGKLHTVEYLGSTPALIKANGDFSAYMCNLCDMDGRVYEVFGNIFDNPKLLGGQHEQEI